MAGGKRSRRKKLKTPSANSFAVRLAEGMAGWAAFAQAAHLSRMYLEYLTYLPIFEIGNGRNWTVLPQKKLKRSKSGRGRFKTVDFVFRSEDHKTGIFLEVKYARYNANHCLQITKDIRKLCELDATDISKKMPPKNVSKYVLIIGQKANILKRIRAAKALSKLTIKNITYFEDKRLLEQVHSAFRDAPDRSAALKKTAWAFPGAGNESWRYWSVLLTVEPWWESLVKINAEESVDDDEVNQQEAEDDDLDHIPGLVKDE